MVCRDAQTHKARPVNPLIASTLEEKLLLKIGECTSNHTCPIYAERLNALSSSQAHKGRKQIIAQSSLSRVPPSFEEAQALHDVYLSRLQQSKQNEVENVWMSETKLEKTMLMFPQERKLVQFCSHDCPQDLIPLQRSPESFRR